MLRSDFKTIEHSEYRQKNRGVVAFLFLVVVAFVFGAISLSMQTGQVVERRITTDFAADSSVYALASHSAQGLNFIAANNLAIAGAVHMSGATHLIADYAAMLMTITAPMDDFAASATAIGQPQSSWGSGTYHKGEMKRDYDKLYEIFKMFGEIYFKSAIGLTTLNKGLAYYSYSGLPRAIEIGAGNQPGAVVIPFKSSILEASSNSDSNMSIDKKIGEVASSLFTKFKNIANFSYSDLTTIRADETFCLPFEASKSIGSDRHKFELWIKSAIAEMPRTQYEPINKVLELIKDVSNISIDILGMASTITRFFGFNQGFSGCGFGKPADGIRGDAPSDEGRLVAPMIELAIRGPFSGRSIYVPGCSTIPAKYLPEGASQPPCPSPGAVTWPEFMNRGRADLKTQFPLSAYTASWQVTDLPAGCTGTATCRMTPTAKVEVGHCVWPIKTKKNRYQTKEVPQTQGQLSGIELWDLTSADTGKVLFLWNGFAGLNYAAQDRGVVSPDSFGGAEPALDDDLCPEFRADVGHTRPINYNPEIGISWAKPVTAPILERLAFDPANFDSHPAMEPKPPAGTYELIMQLQECAKSGSKFKSKNPDGTFNEFKPEFRTVSFLCPVQEHLTFKAGDRIPRGYEHVRSWHNDRVKQMGCEGLAKVLQGIEPKCEESDNRANTGDTDSSGEASADFCKNVPDQYMCWQKGIQKRFSNYKTKSPLSFFIPKLADTSWNLPLSPFEASLRYGVFVRNPIYTDAKDQIKGRGGNDELAHCPMHMDATAKVGGNEVKICDIRPMIGMLNRTFKKPNRENVDKNLSIGAGDANLASGGSLDWEQDSGLPKLVAISEARVVYDPKNNAPANPGGPENEKSKSKAYQMFWPAWKPILVPSRVISKTLPRDVAPLLED